MCRIRNLLLITGELVSFVSGVDSAPAVKLESEMIG